MKQSHEALAGFPVVISVVVQWGDQDAFGHVNNTVYLRWCETARVGYMERIAIWPESGAPEGVGPILAHVACSYRKPVNYPDRIQVTARVTRIGNTSFRMQHHIVSEAQNALVAEAESIIVLLDYARNKTVRVPDEMRRAIEALEPGLTSER